MSIVFVIAVSGVVHAAAPALKDHEEIVNTKDGCGFVIDKQKRSAKYEREALEKLTWGGACIDGLAMGEGIVFPGLGIPGQPAMLPITAPVWYGRTFGLIETRWDNGRVQKSFVWEGQGVMYRSLGVDAPVWSKTHSESSLVSDGGTMVMTAWITEPMVWVTDVKNNSSQQHKCPNGSVQGCEALWAQYAGPVIERIKAFLADNEPKAKARMAETQSLAALWKSKQPAGAAEQKAADARRAAEQQTRNTSAKMKWEQGCWDKHNSLLRDSMAWTGMRSENEERLGRGLKALYEGECKGHVNTKNGLELANQYLRDAIAHKPQDAQIARDTAAYEEERRKREQEDREFLGKLAGAVVSGRNKQERLDSVQNVVAGGSGKRARVTGVRLGPSIYDSSSEVDDASECISLVRKDYKATGISVAYTDYTRKNNCGYPVMLVLCWNVELKYQDCAGRYPQGNTGAARQVEIVSPGGVFTGSLYRPQDPNQKVFIAACRQTESSNHRDSTIMTVTSFDEAAGLGFKCAKYKPPVYGGAEK